MADRGDPTLELRLRRLEDRIELSDLVATYAIVLDDRDFARLADLYTDTSVFDAAEGLVSGRDAVIAYYRKRCRLYAPTYHVVHSQVVTFDDADDDRATGIVCGHAELGYPAEVVWVAMRWLDEYRRVGGRWRFESRRVHQLYAMPLSELPGRFSDRDRKRWPGTAPAPADIPEGLPSWRAWLDSLDTD